MTQRAPLGSASRQCYCVFQQQLQLEGVQPQMLCKLCFFKSSKHPNPWLEGGFLTVFLLGLVTQFSICGPSFARGEEEDSSISPLSRQNLDLFPFSSSSEDPGSDLLSFWKRGRYRLSYGVRTLDFSVY